MRRLRAVGFDLDGTLFDHRRSARAGFEAFLLSLGVKPSEDAHAAWSSAEATQYERWRAFPDSREILRSLRAAGYRIGLLTNGLHDQQTDKLLTVAALVGPTWAI